MYVYIYICMYIYICVYTYDYIYIYMCVCVNLCIIYISVCGGGCLKMRCPFFLSKNPFRNQKKTPRFETYPCIYNILFFWHVFFVSILCWFVPSKIYVFWFSFACSFFSIILSEKMYQIKKCLIGDYNIDIVLYIKKTKLLQKRYQYRLFI